MHIKCLADAVGGMMYGLKMCTPPAEKTVILVIKFFFFNFIRMHINYFLETTVACSAGCT